MMEMVGRQVRVDDVLRLFEQEAKFEVTTVIREELKRRAEGMDGTGSNFGEVVSKLVVSSILMMTEENELVEGDALSLNACSPRCEAMDC